jgi:hypothetical protein
MADHKPQSYWRVVANLGAALEQQRYIAPFGELGPRPRPNDLSRKAVPRRATAAVWPSGGRCAANRHIFRYGNPFANGRPLKVSCPVLITRAETDGSRVEFFRQLPNKDKTIRHDQRNSPWRRAWHQSSPPLARRECFLHTANLSKMFVVTPCLSDRKNSDAQSQTMVSAFPAFSGADVDFLAAFCALRRHPAT